MTRIWSAGEPIAVTAGDDDMPRLFIWNDITHPIARISEQWRVSVDWWSDAGEIDRAYFRVVTKTGLLCELYFDLREQSWRLVRVYD